MRLSAKTALALTVILGLPVTWIFASYRDTPKNAVYLKMQQGNLPDYGQLHRYDAANQSLSHDDSKIILFGDSITEFWNQPSTLGSHVLLNRGIQGQTTGQMLLRFRQDVINLKPDAVVILGGINDLWYQPADLRITESNYASMAELARLHHIRPIFATLLPIDINHSHPHILTQIATPDQVKALNAWIVAYCKENSLQLIDYNSAFLNQQGNARGDLFGDGLHPNQNGYRVMESVLRESIGTSSL